MQGKQKNSQEGYIYGVLYRSDEMMRPLRLDSPSPTRAPIHYQGSGSSDGHLRRCTPKN